MPTPAEPPMGDEIADASVPQVVLNHFNTIRPGDMFLQRDRWVRVLATEVVKAPEGRGLPDTLKIAYTLTSRVVASETLTDPGDRLCRIVREVHPGDIVISIHDPDMTKAVLVTREPYDSNGRAEVLLAYDGESVTLDRSEIYLYSTTQTGTTP